MKHQLGSITKKKLSIMALDNIIGNRKLVLKKKKKLQHRHIAIFCVSLLCMACLTQNAIAGELSHYQQDSTYREYKYHNIKNIPYSTNSIIAEFRDNFSNSYEIGVKKRSMRKVIIDLFSSPVILKINASTNMFEIEL